MHDRLGNLLKVGDKVTILATITGINSCEDYCNVYLVTEYPRRPDGLKETISGINTAVMDKVE